MIDEGVLRWFGHAGERMEKDRIAKRFYVGKCAGSRSAGRARKRCSDTVKDCLRKKVWMSGRQGEWCMIRVNGGRLPGGDAWGVARGTNP